MKGFIKYSAIIAAAMFCVTQAQAFTVSYAANAGTAIAQNDGSQLAGPSLIEFGYTSSTKAQISNAFYNAATPALGVSAVNALFSIWATDQTTSGTDPTAPGTFSSGSGNGGAGFFSKQIYMLAFDASTIAGASQVGVFSGGPNFGQSNGSDPWTFPANDQTQIGIECSDVTAPGVVLGGYGTDNGAGDAAWMGGTPNGLLLAAFPVPEPSTIMLVVLGMLGAIGLIRRRH